MQICGEDIKHFKRHLTTHISLPRIFGFESSFANDIEQSLISSEHPSYITFIMSFATAAKKKKRKCNSLFSAKCFIFWTFLLSVRTKKHHRK